MTHPWARAGSHRFPGDPSHAFALLQDPGRAGKISPWRSCRCCPRSTQTEGLSGYIISRLTQGFSIRCLRFTSDVAVSHARLASGWRAAPLPGGGRTLWITSKGFRLHLHSPFQDFSCRKGRLRQAPFAGPEAVLAYLGRYTHRVAISNSRLVEEVVRFLAAAPSLKHRTALNDRLRRRAARLRGRAAAGCRYRVPQPALPEMPRRSAREAWLAERQAELLPVPYFHIGFTAMHKCRHAMPSGWKICRAWHVVERRAEAAGIGR